MLDFAALVLQHRRLEGVHRRCVLAEQAGGFVVFVVVHKRNALDSLPLRSLILLGLDRSSDHASMSQAERAAGLSARSFNGYSCAAGSKAPKGASPGV
jgi:hypothetical protein